MKPKLSIVATSRNDNHGGNLLQRMQIFVDGLIAQCKRHDLNAELILVEWNPPADQPKLHEALRWPEDPTPCQVRIIEVPPELHHRLRHSEELPLFQMIAKNVGIFRARGRFILSTNIDIIFSDGLMGFLCSDSLRKGNFYRVNRHDVSENVPQYNSFDDILDFCKNNTIRICHRDGITDCRTKKTTLFFPHFPFVGIRLHLIPGWRILIRLGKLKFFRLPFKFSGHYRQWLRLHTNACGDFTLMAKDDWLRFRGAPELEIFSLHLDSLVCYMAHCANLKEIILKHPIYHIEHSGGWTPEVEKDRSLYNRLEKVQVPVMLIDELDSWIADMYKRKRPIINNDENWGLSMEELKETIIQS